MASSFVVYLTGSGAARTRDVATHRSLGAPRVASTPSTRPRELRERAGADVQPRVLVVEDDVPIRLLVREVLTDEGYIVKDAPNGAAALDVLDGWTPHVILLDMRMPVMDGWQFLEAYRRRSGPHAPVVVCTAAVDPAKRAAAVQADDVLSKPFDVDQLVEIVETYARRAGRRKSGAQRPSSRAA
ncbi:MAG: response regulator [Chloroflexi bacterium]|nr:response regulator [Chloroflexota bacterium]